MNLFLPQWLKYYWEAKTCRSGLEFLKKSNAVDFSALIEFIYTFRYWLLPPKYTTSYIGILEKRLGGAQMSVTFYEFYWLRAVTWSFPNNRSWKIGGEMDSCAVLKKRKWYLLTRVQLVLQKFQLKKSLFSAFLNNRENNSLTLC